VIKSLAAENVVNEVLESRVGWHDHIPMNGRVQADGSAVLSIGAQIDQRRGRKRNIYVELDYLVA
jgi:hypothetical protein